MDKILKEVANATARKKVSLSKSIFCVQGYHSPKSVDLICVFSRVIVLLITYLSVPFVFLIIVQHYDTKLHCILCVMSYCFVVTLFRLLIFCS